MTPSVLAVPLRESTRPAGGSVSPQQLAPLSQLIGVLAGQGFGNSPVAQNMQIGMDRALSSLGENPLVKMFKLLGGADPASLVEGPARALGPAASFGDDIFKHGAAAFRTAKNSSNRISPVMRLNDLRTIFRRQYHNFPGTKTQRAWGRPPTANNISEEINALLRQVPAVEIIRDGHSTLNGFVSGRGVRALLESLNITHTDDIAFIAREVKEGGLQLFSPESITKLLNKHRPVGASKVPLDDFFSKDDREWFAVKDVLKLLTGFSGF